MAEIVMILERLELFSQISHWAEEKGHKLLDLHWNNVQLESLQELRADLLVFEWSVMSEYPMRFCQRLRESGCSLPFLVLSPRFDIVSKQIAFSAGVDDYLVMPFELLEFFMRAKNLLRRPKTYRFEVIRLGELVLDTQGRRVTYANKNINLNSQDLTLLEFLMLHPNELFRAEQLLMRVWPTDSSASCTTVRQSLMRIRRALDITNDQIRIVNLHSVGYRLEVAPNPELTGMSFLAGVPTY